MRHFAATRCQPPFLRKDDRTLLHYTLYGEPEEQTLVLHTTFGTLSYLICENQHPRLVMQDQFTHTELSVLLPLLDLFPDYCPSEVLYASFYNNNTAEHIVERCRQRLNEAQAMGIWDQEMRPVRGALSRARLKLRAFGIDIIALLATGYMLKIQRQYV